MRCSPRGILAVAMFLTAFAASVTLTSGCGGQPGNAVSSVSAPVTTHDLTVLLPRTTTSSTTAASAGLSDTAGRQADILLSALDINREFKFLKTLASDGFQGRRTGTQGGRDAAAYVATRYTELNLQPWSDLGLASFAQDFTAAGFQSTNVIGVIPGTNPAGGYIILGAHYDHLGVNSNGQAYNGADDNAAGVAAVLEAATIFRQTGIKPAKTIVFCAFSGEEEDQLGSTALGKLINERGLSGKVEMINIDGIGATGGDYFGVWDEGFTGAAPLVNSLEQAGQALGIKVKEEGTDIGSDAQSFDWKYSIPAVTVDWSWGNDPSLWHPYYHTIYDDADVIDTAVMEKATRVALLGLWLQAS